MQRKEPNLKITTELFWMANPTTREVKRELAKVEDINNTRVNNLSLLHFVLSLPKNLKYVKTLVEAGANINQKSEENGNTPIMQAFLECDIKVIQYLLHQDPDLYVANKAHENVFFIAKQCGDIEKLKLLLANAYLRACGQ